MASAGTTPYNSIYSIIRTGTDAAPPPESEPRKGPCCLHGKVCPNQDEEESAPYVNLMTQEKAKAEVSESESRREKNLRILTREMKTLQLGEESDRHKKSHKKQSKKVEKVLSLDLVSNIGDGQSGKKYKRIKEQSKKNKKKKKKRERSPDLIRIYGDTSESKKSGIQKKSKELRKSQEKSKKSRKSRSRTALDKIVKNKVLSSSYLGIKTWKDAEENVTEPADFRLYHRMDKPCVTDLESTLPLFIVYKSSSGKYQHYRVRQIPAGGNSSMTYMVEHGQMNAEIHASLEHLVRFYQTQFIPHETKGQPMVDAFPCWTDSN